MIKDKKLKCPPEQRSRTGLITNDALKYKSRASLFWRMNKGEALKERNIITMGKTHCTKRWTKMSKE